MAVYRGKYVLEGLATISPEMEKDLDTAYDICKSLRDELPCEMCGRCCHQPNIIVRPEENKQPDIIGMKVTYSDGNGNTYTTEK